jgi:hypothetical protein
MAMEDELSYDNPPINLVGSIFRTDGGWEFEVYQEDGGEFASGTAPTINQILDMMQDYLYAEYYSSNEDLSNNKAMKYILGDVSEED